MKKSLMVLLFGLAAGPILQAQDHTPTGAFVLNVDYARFRYDDQSGYLEIYYAFYPHLLTYVSSSAGMQGGVLLHTKLINNATKAANVDRRMLLPLVISDTSSASFRHPFTSQTGHAVPFGAYTLEIMAADSLNPSRRDSISLGIDIQAYPSTVSVSDVELASRVQPSTKTDDPFYKNSLEVLPNATLVFGVATHPVLFNYTELYGLSPEISYTIKNQIIGADGKTTKETTKTRKYASKAGVDAGMINVTSVIPGRYTYRLQLYDDKAVEVAHTEKTFYVYNPHLRPPQAAEAGFHDSQLSGLMSEELDAEFRRAKYMANKDEIKFYSQLESESGKREFLAKFWEKVEMGRGDQAPIKRSEYLRRVEKTTRSYSVLKREGWLSDRGRVYILYGEPDQIENTASDGRSKPYQIWHYYGLERGVEFIFVDRLGNGDYQLVHSTKRGELRDDKWEEQLN
jgi:GWxTD domain-containing protein